MRGTVLWTTLMAVLAGAGAWGELAECQLTEGPLDPPVLAGWGGGQPQWDRPDGLTALPALRTEPPLYVPLDLWERQRSRPRRHALAVLDQSGGQVYDTLYVDTDLDSDLADEQPLRGEEFAGLRETLVFPAIEIGFPGEPAGGTKRVRLALANVGSAWRLLCVVADRAWFGEVRIGDRAMRIALIDLDFDGRADSHLDRLWLDRNRDGEFDGFNETTPFSKALFVEDQLLGVAAGDSLATLRIGPYEGPLGRVSLDATDGDGRPVKVTSLWVNGRETQVGLPVSGNTLELPPDRYYQASARAQIIDPEGGELALWLGMSMPTIEAGRQHKVTVGGPATVSMRTQTYDRPDETLLYVMLDLRTASGARIESMSREGSCLGIGRIVVKRPDGSVLQEKTTGFG